MAGLLEGILFDAGLAFLTAFFFDAIFLTDIPTTLFFAAFFPAGLFAAAFFFPVFFPEAFFFAGLRAVAFVPDLFVVAMPVTSLDYRQASRVKGLPG